MLSVLSVARILSLDAVGSAFVGSSSLEQFKEITKAGETTLARHTLNRAGIISRA